MKDTPQILRECAAGDRLLHRKSLLHIADEIERLRKALDYIVDCCEESSIGRQDKIDYILRKARATLGKKK